MLHLTRCVCLSTYLSENGRVVLFLLLFWRRSMAPLDTRLEVFRVCRALTNTSALAAIGMPIPQSLEIVMAKVKVRCDDPRFGSLVRAGDIRDAGQIDSARKNQKALR